jgi:hypothetical protein
MGETREGTLEAKRAAAVAAVYSYLALRAGGPPEAAVQTGGQPSGAGAGEAGFHAGNTGFHPSLWALYGRQALMNQRVRMQARRRA